MEKSELDPKKLFRRLPVRPQMGQGQTHFGTLADLKIQKLLSDLYCQVRQLMSLVCLLTAAKKQVHLGSLHMRLIQWHLKNHWGTPESVEKVIPIPRSPPTLKMVAPRGKCPSRSATTSTQPCSSDLYRCLNQATRKQVACKLSGTKSCLSGPKSVPRPLFKQDCTHSNRQHHSCCLHKQRRRYEVGPTVCPTMANPDLVLQKSGETQGQTQSRQAEYDARQAIQARPDHPNRVVSHSRGLPLDVHQVTPTSNRPICNKVQQQATSVHVTSY